MITEKCNTINKELFRRYFDFQSWIDMHEALSETQKIHGNKQIVQVIRSGLIDLSKEIKKMPKD